MAKSKATKPLVDLEEMDEFDFSDLIMNQPDDDVMFDFMKNFFDASRDQSNTAVELTKIVVGQNPDKSLTEDEIFSIYQKAFKVVDSNWPVKDLIEKMQK